MNRFRISLPEILLLVALAFILWAFFLTVAREVMGSRDMAWDIEFSPDGELLVRASDLGVAVFDRSTGDLVHRFDDEVADLAISPDSQLLATGGVHGSLAVRDLATGALVAEMGSHPSWVKVGFSPDSTNLYSRGRGETAVKVWNPHNGEPTGEFETHRLVHAFRLSPDGRVLATATMVQNPDGHEVELWEVGTGRRLSKLTGPERAGINNLVFAADNRTLAVGLSVLKVRIQDTVGDPGHNLLLDVRGNECLRFSPSGRLVATTYWAGATVWDAASGAQVARFGNHQGNVAAAEFSRDEKRLITAGDDGTINTWEIATGELLDRVTGMTLRPSPIPWLTLVAFGLWLIAWIVVAVRSGGHGKPLAGGHHHTESTWGRVLVPFAAACFILNGMAVIAMSHLLSEADPIQFLFWAGIASTLLFAGTGVLMFTRRLAQQWAYCAVALVILGIAAGYDFFWCVMVLASV